MPSQRAWSRQPRPRSEPPVLVSPVEHMRDPVSPVEPPGLEPVSPAESYHREHGRAWSRQPSSRSRPHQRATGPGPTSTGSVSPAESPGTASPTEPPGLVSSVEPTAPVSLAASTGPGFTSRSHRLGLNSRAHETGLIC